MKRFLVTVERVVTVEVIIEADTSSEAKQRALYGWGKHSMQTVSDPQAANVRQLDTTGGSCHGD
ncbi:MAG: hypothetical protein P1U67_11640 [Alcanivoracaceae bacterium]|nr:hypothetical protein [Alcanivoracaceae bacterium]